MPKEARCLQGEVHRLQVEGQAGEWTNSEIDAAGCQVRVKSGGVRSLIKN